MRYFIIVLLFASVSHVYAGDTLTRAQVYAYYDVGDTFDYRHYGQEIITGGGPTTTSISFIRFLVQSIYWSPDSMTKYIVCEQVYPLPMLLDTMILDSISGYEISVDCDSIDGNQVCSSAYVTGLANYWGMKTNCIYYNYFKYDYPVTSLPYDEIFAGEYNCLYSDGFGPVSIVVYGGFHNIEWTDTYNLIYYSGDSGTYGTPYTSYPDAIANISPDEKIKVYPTVSNGIFNIDASDERQLPLTFAIYDLQGRKVNETLLHSKKQEVNNENLGDGIYIWKAKSEQSIIQSGKITIER